MLHKPSVAPDFRETRDFACEVKFLLDEQQALAIRAWARTHLQPDTHGGGEYGDAYQVSSIYYDTRDFAVYRRVGSYGRSKYRVRRYGQFSHVFLERKTKTKVQVSKRRSLVPIDDVARLTLPMQAEHRGYWFQRRLQARKLAPVCRISYQRIARVGQTETGPCRLTLDCDVQACACDVHSVSELGQNSAPAAMSLLRDKPYILELKYRYALPTLFRQLLVEFAPLPQRVSKYRLAVQTLALAGPGSLEGSSEAC